MGMCFNAYLNLNKVMIPELFLDNGFLQLESRTTCGPAWCEKIGKTVRYGSLVAEWLSRALTEHEAENLKSRAYCANESRWSHNVILIAIYDTLFKKKKDYWSHLMYIRMSLMFCLNYEPFHNIILFAVLILQRLI